MGQGKPRAKGKAPLLPVLMGKRARRQLVCECGPSGSAPLWAARGAANHRPTLPPF